MKKIIAFIPSRYESTRFPGKPLALIAGKPMIQHVYERTLSSAHVEDAFVATDDERIAHCVKGFGGKAVMTGPTHPSGTDRIAEAALKLGLQDHDLVVNVQGDQPAFDPSCIPELLKPFQDDPELPMTTLMIRIREKEEIENPNNVKVVSDRKGFALYFSRSPIPFYRDTGENQGVYKHLGFYAYPVRFLRIFVSLSPGPLESAEKLEPLRALEHGFKIKVVETRFDSTEVDTPKDIKKAEHMIRRQET
ncbi:MAG: 3-deoxy-manno-octulosonate cytidylyltransferase [Deltaproteobacteria bacterium]|jgi:3-deoxy-manno-octulosonate cytidylyltransferase (CMP-KDO synthetase)|nr:3-deoxy-manno-octulosonate cytidylyltransferase [Deltaproteobacteria bacterium]